MPRERSFAAHLIEKYKQNNAHTFSLSSPPLPPLARPSLKHEDGPCHRIGFLLQMRASAREEVEDPSSNGVIGTAILRDVLLVVSRDHRIRVPLLVVAAIHKVLALGGKRHAASVAIDCRAPA